MSTTTTETVDTRSQEEYDSMCSEKSSKELEASEKENYIEQLEAKLERLDEAYDKVKKLKEQFEDDWTFDVKKSYEYYNEGNLKWDGSHYDTVVFYVDNYFRNHIDSFVDFVDSILDDIGNLRTKYENEILDETTILSGLWKAINSLWDSIKNYWN